MRVVLAILLLCGPVLGQTVEVRQILTGVDCVENHAGLIFVSKDSVPKVESVGFVDLGKIPEKPQVSRITVTDKDRNPIQTERIGTGIWYFHGQGKIWIDARVIDLPSQFVLDESWTIDLPGDAPKPGPGPKPGPTPVPPPVPNEYNVGATSYFLAPKQDFTNANQLAATYRAQADRLFGRPTLAPIQNVLNDISAKFASKRCPDQQTCEQWAKWKSAVDAALIAEQKKRIYFQRTDWYNALVEVAISLESIK